MFTFSIMLSNGHEMTVQAVNIDEAVNAALSTYPDDYVVAFKRLPDEEDSGSEGE